MSFNSQTTRILETLLANKGREVASVDLHRAGSGKENGYCASFSRRISDIRALGYHVQCRKEMQPDGQMHTFYTLTEELKQAELTTTN